MEAPSHLTVTYGLRYDVHRPPEAIVRPHSLFAEVQNGQEQLCATTRHCLGSRTRTENSGSCFYGHFYDPLQTDQYRLALLNRVARLFRISRCHHNPSRQRSRTIVSVFRAGVNLRSGPHDRVPRFRRCTPSTPMPRSAVNCRRDFGQRFLPIHEGHPSSRVPQYQPGAFWRIPGGGGPF